MRFLSIIFVISFLVSCQNQESKNVQQPSEDLSNEKTGQAFITDDESTPNALQIAMGSEDHTTLVKAVQAAHLENALVNAGPLTVFAPTNQAFDNLPSGTVTNLLKPENKDDLANILKYHVSPGNYSTDLLGKVSKLGMANNGSVPITTNGDDIMVGEAKIIGTVQAGNGIVHIIDKVLLPPSN